MTNPEDSDSNDDQTDEEEELLDMFGEGGDTGESDTETEQEATEPDEQATDDDVDTTSDDTDEDVSETNEDDVGTEDGEEQEDGQLGDDGGEIVPDESGTIDTTDDDESEIVPEESGPVDTVDDESTGELFEMAADNDEDVDMEADEFERALTRDTRSAEEIISTLDDTGALDPETDAEIDLTSDELQTEDYTTEYLESLFPLLTRSAEWLGTKHHAKEFWHPQTAPVVKDLYTWEHFKIKYYYTDYDWDTFTGTKPRAGEGRFAEEESEESGIIEFDASEYLGYEPELIQARLTDASNHAEEVHNEFDNRTVDVAEELDEDEFFETQFNHTTVVNRYDLEKSVPMSKKEHFEEIDRYWVNKPFACVILFRSSKENEMKYYVVEPHLTPIEQNVLDFLIEKLRRNIKYAGGDVTDAQDSISRAEVIEENTYKLLDRYNIYERPDEGGGSSSDSGMLGKLLHPLRGGRKQEDSMVDSVNEAGSGEDGFFDQIKQLFTTGEGSSGAEGGIEREYVYMPPKEMGEMHGLSVRPEPELVAEDSRKLNEYQVKKLLYYLKRDFVGYQKIDPIKRDINVEDVSCNGYNMPVFVYHTDYENIITNVFHGEDDLDEFVVKLAQRSGKGISKRQPQVDCTLPDGSRAQLTLGQEVSDKGTNYTIRQFKDVPFTPVDLINWKTFSLEEMAFLWLCIENHKSLIFAGGTASGKTTSLNAVSLFIPSSAKIVSIEDTREVELPQRNWIASVTRPSFSDDEKGDIDEFDLLEAALRQRPDYIVMGEIRGEEGRTLFQVMSTGHTTYTTFHADTVAEVMKRFTTEPINVSKTLFTALDIVSIQTATRVDGRKVRRNKVLTEVNGYDAETDEINVQDIYQWQAETDRFVKQTGATTLEEIKFDRGWNQEKLDEELFKRKTVLAYLIKKRMSKYTQVGATIQAFMTNQETTLELIATDELENSIDDLREMESLSIDVDPEKEALVPRPTPNDELESEVDSVLDEAEEQLFSGRKSGVEDAELIDAFDSGADDTGDDFDAEADTQEALDIVQQEAKKVTNDESTDADASEEVDSDIDADDFTEELEEADQPELPTGDVDEGDTIVDDDTTETAVDVDDEIDTEDDDFTEELEESTEQNEFTEVAEETIDDDDDSGFTGLFGEEVDDSEEEVDSSGGSIFEDDANENDLFGDAEERELEDIFEDGEQDSESSDDDIDLDVEDSDEDIDDIF